MENYLYKFKEKEYAVGSKHLILLIVVALLIGCSPDFDIIGEEYYATRNPVDVGGKLAYEAHMYEGPNFCRFIVYDGKEHGREYCSASSPADISGKLAYIVGDKGRMFVVFDGKRGNDYLSVIIRDELKGALFYQATEHDWRARKYFYVVGNDEVGRQYDNIWKPEDVGGELAYIAEQDGKSFLVLGQQELGRQYDNVTSWVNIGGEVAYVAEKDGQQFVVYLGKEGKKYARVTYLRDIGGKLSYLAIKKGRCYETNASAVAVYDGEEEGLQYDTVLCLDGGIVNVNGELAYVAKQDGHRFVVYDGEEYGKEYDAVYWPFEFDGKLAYFAKDGDKTMIVIGDEKLGKSYSMGDYPYKPIKVNDKIAYIAEDGDREFVMYDGKKVDFECGMVSDLGDVAGKLFFECTIFSDGGTKHYVVMER
jgi:hypothetical protein